MFLKSFVKKQTKIKQSVSLPKQIKRKGLISSQSSSVTVSIKYKYIPNRKNLRLRDCTIRRIIIEAIKTQQDFATILPKLLVEYSKIGVREDKAILRARANWRNIKCLLKKGKLQ